jgi:hydroxymethylbilane synthase
MPLEKNTIVIGTRGSALALAQTERIRAQIHKIYPRLEIEIKIIKTSGDLKTTASLTQSETVGFFTKELEQALLRRKIDMAVHSLKDLPTELRPGLTLGAVTVREEANDVLVCHDKTDESSPEIVFTSSPRRALQAKLLWPKSQIRPIRGNIETRLLKIAEGNPGDSLLLAAAGLRRLNYLRGDEDQGTLTFDPPMRFKRLTLVQMIPAPGQAAVAVEILSENNELLERLKSINHAPTMAAVTAERSFLNSIGGGCSAPIGAHAVVAAEALHLAAIVGGEGQVWRSEKSGSRREARALGLELAQEYLTKFPANKASS